MHAPDGFLNVGTAAATAAISVGVVGLSLRHSRAQLGERQTPIAGLTGSFVFAAQMVTFPVAAGTSGHLLGGLLAAVLLGPATGTLVVATVILLQALVFADGGVTALGYNVLNMAVITSYGGYAIYLGFRRLLPRNSSGVVMAGGLAGAASVVLGAMAFSLEWLFGATAPVSFDTVFGSMVGVHVLIGIGEGLITAATLAAILGVRPDLVHGAGDLDRRRPGRTPTMDRPRHRPGRRSADRGGGRRCQPVRLLEPRRAVPGGHRPRDQRVDAAHGQLAVRRLRHPGRPQRATQPRHRRDHRRDPHRRRRHRNPQLRQPPPSPWKIPWRRRLHRRSHPRSPQPRHTGPHRLPRGTARRKDRSMRSNWR